MRKILYAGLLALLSACTNDSQMEESKYVITFDDSRFVEAKDLVKDVEIIELDTAKEAFAPNIVDVSVCGDRIFCYSTDQNGVIKVFDLNGKYLYQMSHHGRANYEWIRLKSMCVNEEEDAVILTDAESKKVLVYTMDGKFVKSMKLGAFDYHQITYKDGHYYSPLHTFMTGFKPAEETDHRLNIYDENGKFETTAIPLKQNDGRMFEMSERHFYMGQEQCLLCPTLDDTVYMLEDGRAIPYATYNYKGDTPMYTDKDLQQAVDDDIWLGGVNNTYYSGKIVESPTLIIRRMGYENAKDIIFNKESGEVITTTFDCSILMRHHLSDCFLYPWPLCYADGYYYGLVDYELLALPPQYTDGHMPECLKDIAEKVKQKKVNNLIVRYKI